MITPTELHTYRCLGCRSVYVTTSKAEYGVPYRCACGLWLRFQFTQPITTDHDREIAARGFVWNNVTPSERSTAPIKRKCDECINLIEQEREIYLPGAGRFCSPACADAGAAKHEAFLRRVAETREKMPWLAQMTADGRRGK